MRTKIFTIGFWKAAFSHRKPLPDVRVKPSKPKHMLQEQNQISTTVSTDTESFQPEGIPTVISDDRGALEQRTADKEIEKAEDAAETELIQWEKSRGKQRAQSEGSTDQEITGKSEVKSERELVESQEDIKDGKLIVRSELNLEQNSIFTVSTYREKSREIAVREVAPNGDVIERKAIIGRMADGIETGVLTTYHFKVYLALIGLWEKEGRPIQEPVNFTSLRVMRHLGMTDSGEEYRHFKRWLRNLRQIPITFINSFRAPGATEHTDLADITVLNHLRIYERKNVGKDKKTRGYGEFRFDDHILTNLIGNYTHPLRLDVIRSFKRHRDLAILLYTYIDRNLAFKNKYEVGLEKLFGHLDLSQRHVKYPSDRKRVIDPVLKELQDKPLSTGTLSGCHIVKTEDGRDYKLVCCKEPLNKGIQDSKSRPQLSAPQPEPEPEELDSQLISSLVQKGLTQKQVDRLLSEKGEDVVKAQLQYFPFRMTEYKAQGREVNEAAMLHESIKDNWEPPAGYFQAEKDKEREAKRQALKAEYREKVQKAEAEAEEWAARSPGDRIASQLDFWIGHKKLLNHHPTEDEIQAKKKELVSELQTEEEYRQRLIDEIDRDMRRKDLLV